MMYAETKIKSFDNAYDAGYDAGRYGPDTINSNWCWFNTKERMMEWERGKRDGDKKRMAEREL